MTPLLQFFVIVASQIVLVVAGGWQRLGENRLFSDSLAITIAATAPMVLIIAIVLTAAARLRYLGVAYVTIALIGVAIAPPMAFFASSGAFLTPATGLLAGASELGQIAGVVLARINPTFAMISLLPAVVSVAACLSVRQRGEIQLRKSFIILGLLVTLSMAEVAFSRRSYHPVSSLLSLSFNKTTPKQFAPTTDVRFYQTATPSTGRRPDIILIAIESFSAQFLKQVGEDGRPIMANYLALAKESIEVERFYAGSTFTLKGHESLLLGVTPSLRGPIADMPGTNIFMSLPSALRSLGYNTVFYQAQPNLGFAHTDLLAARSGFNRAKAMNEEFVGAEDVDSIWGWGLQDDVFYQKVIEDLERNDLRDPQIPVFAFLATVSNHQPFDELPRRYWTAYGNPDTIMKRYANSVRASDTFLGECIARLKRHPRLQNAIVIVTADHSFSFGSSGDVDVERSFADVAFRIPLLIHCPDQLVPRQITTGQFSQRDVASTVLGLAGDVRLGRLFGRSILDLDLPCSPAVFVQPYSGGYVCVVDWPLKYVYSVSRQKAALVDISTDRAEVTNQIANLSPVARERFQSLVDSVLREAEIHSRTSFHAHP